jgi:hypothetical protein
MSWPAELELSAKHRRALKDESIRHFEEPIVEMGKAELREHFGAKTGRINRSELIKNIIWQAYEQLQLRQRERFEGNIRSFWYSHVKPTLSRADALSDSGVAYKSMIDMFVRLVMERELVRYQDFGFADERAEDRQIGDKNGHILLVAEKRGQWHLVKRIAEDFDVTIAALGGQPSLLSTEYFARELTAAGIDLAQPLPLLTIVDYDPAGDSIARTFIRQLKTFGAKELLRTDLAVPAHMTEEQIALNRYRLSRKKRQRKKVARWLGLTGGIDRKPYGLEADAMTTEQLVAVFEQAVAVYLKLGVEQVRKRRRKRQLVRLIKRKILQRLGLE